jgi:hypothetical protein
MNWLYGAIPHKTATFVTSTTILSTPTCVWIIRRSAAALEFKIILQFSASGNRQNTHSLNGITLNHWYSTLFVRVTPPDIIYLRFCTPKVVGVFNSVHPNMLVYNSRLCTVYSLHLKQIKYIAYKIIYYIIYKMNKGLYSVWQKIIYFQFVISRKMFSRTPSWRSMLSTIRQITFLKCIALY